MQAHLERLRRTASHLASPAGAPTPAAAASAGSLTIGYWNIRGLGAPLRMMAEYAGADYEAKLHDSDTDEWAELKAELIKTNPLANLPYVIDGDTVVTQSNACFAYLGEKFGLLGSDATERVQCEQCLCQVMDLRNEAVELFYGRGVSVSPGGISPSEHGAAYLSEKVSVHYSKMEGWLTTVGGDFLVGDSPTAPDFHLWEMLDQHSALAADLGEKDPLEACPALQAFAARFRALPELAGYFAGPLAALPPNNKSALWGGQAPLAQAGEDDGGFVGLEEIFLKVQDVDAAVEFYHGTLGIPMERRDGDRAFLQCSSSHIVLQRDGVGRHDGGGPLHYAFTVTEEAFDRIVDTLRPDGTGDPTDPSGTGYLTRGPMGSGTNGRALFVFDPDGNEAEINTRYLYRPVWGEGGVEL